MKTIGIIGGMSWESTQTYYAQINRGINRALGGLHSARLLLYSVDFAEIEALQHKGEWQATADILIQAARTLEMAGADFLLIATNTMHKVAADVGAHVTIPLLHIADATAAVLQQAQVRRIGLLGTAFTMEQAFYRERLEAQGIEVLIPNADERADVHRIIYQQLCRGEIRDDSRQRYLRVGNDSDEILQNVP
tara:strand:+ start:1357 stop:1935 length:579 start_codon:yes stop_codon:yes gene_type:complete